MKPVSVSILVPAYNRVGYLPGLLESVLMQHSRPEQLVIAEDVSRERCEIRATIDRYRPLFLAESIDLTYVENSTNRGYDGNLRALLELASSEYALFLGNDDELLPDCVATVRRYIATSGAHFLSRAMCQHEIHPDGSKRIVALIKPGHAQVSGHLDDWGRLFGLCAVISGLVFNVRSARAVSNSMFDGGLYYQYHLALACNNMGGSSYIPDPIVSCRADLAPEFGGAVVETAFTPGRYTAESRIKMASSVVEIYRHHRQNNTLGRDIRAEFNKRQSIHIFEMMSDAPRYQSWRMFIGFVRLGLFRHPLPVVLLVFNLTFGKSGRPIFLKCKALVKRLVIAVGAGHVVRNSTITENL